MEEGVTEISSNVAVEEQCSRPPINAMNFHPNESKNLHAKDKLQKSEALLRLLASLKYGIVITQRFPYVYYKQTHWPEVHQYYR